MRDINNLNRGKTMIKHVGKHNDKKVVILYRTVPGEEHMCLVAYSDLLPSHIHDSVMQVLQSNVGQSEKTFADALFRNMTKDGRNILETLHREGYIKKVQTSQVLVTPTSSSSVRLDEMNRILQEMEKGEEASKKLEDLDKNAGMKVPSKKEVDDTKIEMDSISRKVEDLQKQAEGYRAKASTLLDSISDSVMNADAVALVEEFAKSTKISKVKLHKLLEQIVAIVVPQQSNVIKSQAEELVKEAEKLESQAFELKSKHSTTNEPA